MRSLRSVKIFSADSEWLLVQLTICLRDMHANESGNHHH